MSEHKKKQDSPGSRASPGSLDSPGPKGPVELLDFRWKHMTPAIRETISFKFSPIPAESDAFRSFSGDGDIKIPNITGDILGGYCYCHPVRPSYWDVFPNPIGFIARLPEWITEGRLMTELFGTPKRGEQKGFLQIITTRQMFKYGDLAKYKSKQGQSFTSEELAQIVHDNFILRTREEMKLSAGINPVGVRRFFETQVFSNPPVVELTPALLKPYLLSEKQLDRLPDRFKSGAKNVPVPIYSGLYHGDTCCGSVFNEMHTQEEEAKYKYKPKSHTFGNQEERDAFFLQICKILIAGIEKDDGDSDRKICVNHGNYGKCLVDLFSDDSDYTCHKICYNYSLLNRVVMLLFHKIIEVNKKIRRTIDMDKSQQTMMNFASTSKSVSGKIPHYVKKAREEALVSSTRAMTEQTKKERAPLIALLERYFNIIASLTNRFYDTGGVLPINPLNIELCAAEVELDPTSPDSAGLVRYIAKFAKPVHPDGRTMAHLLAEECPRILMRMMVDPAVKMKFLHDRETRFEIQRTGEQFEAHPIAYLIADARGDTPKSLAIKKLNEARGESSILPKLQQVESSAIAFFESLPEPQRDKVHVEREHFIKRHAGHSKLRSALSKASGRDVSEGLEKMFKSRRDFDDASKIESLLTGRQPSLMTGMRMKSEKSGNSDKSGFTVIPEGLGGGGGGCGCGINMFGSTLKRSRRTRRHRKRGGHRERTNGISGRFGRKRKNTARKYRNRK
ncbi:MAG: hypothetical protein WCP68_16210 [Enhydrobacter sp.]